MPVQGEAYMEGYCYKSLLRVDRLIGGGSGLSVFRAINLIIGVSARLGALQFAADARCIRQMFFQEPVDLVLRKTLPLHWLSPIGQALLENKSFPRGRCKSYADNEPSLSS